jgi:hypothetical protein
VSSPQQYQDCWRLGAYFIFGYIILDRQRWRRSAHQVVIGLVAA